MLTKQLLKLFAACLLAGSIAGCGKSPESTPPPPPPPTAPPAPSVSETAKRTVETVKTEADKVVQQAQDTVKQATTEAQKVAKQAEQTATNLLSSVNALAKQAEKQASTVAAQASQEADSLLAKAKSLLGEKKTQEAAPLLEKLSGMVLKPEQQQLLGGLKTELSTLYADIDKGLVDLKSSIDAKNYTEATSKVASLASYQMTPEQQKVLDGLKAQLQKLAGTTAAEEGKKAVGNLLGR